MIIPNKSIIKIAIFKIFLKNLGYMEYFKTTMFFSLIFSYFTIELMSPYAPDEYFLPILQQDYLCFIIILEQ